MPSYVRHDPADKRSVTTYVDSDTHARLAISARKNGVSVCELARRAMIAWLEDGR